MGKICLAVDIGASSGRLIMSTFKDNKIELQEIHRFENQMYQDSNSYYWDIDHLFDEILEGLKKYQSTGLDAESIGVDTWAVDYVLLGEEGKKICPIYAYRDNRTRNTIKKVLEKYSRERIYEKTGIQFIQFNTLYQLYEHVRANPEKLEDTSQILMIPDYLNYLLCNKVGIEYTNATTTQLYNSHDHQWDEELLHIAGISKTKFPNIIQPGTILGTLTKKVEEEVGIKELKVIAPATHDTGSAVVSVPAIDDDFAYISSGTWSLMGVENKEPICTKEALQYNFTNEGGAYGTIRFLKNIMGLWLIQEVKRLLGDEYSFSELVTLAKEAKDVAIINPNNNRFLNPPNMIEEIKAYCKETGQECPHTPGELAKCIFESLALQYKQVLQQLRTITGKPIHKIHIVGGGSQNHYLNQLCADYTGCEVYAGPIEATAIGNLMVQYITLGEIKSLEEARRIIHESFSIEKFVPNAQHNADEKWDRFVKLF